MTRYFQKRLQYTAIVSGVILVTILGWYGYANEYFVKNHGAENLSADSPLLPKGWVTYRGNQWSVGYPKHYKVVEGKDGAISFLPTGEDGSKTYFAVREEQKTLSSLKIARNNAGYPAPVDVTIANYPAVKYTTGNNHIEYFVVVNATLIQLISDDPTDPTASMMLATFAVEE